MTRKKEVSNTGNVFRKYLKGLLREKRMTYRQLAVELKVSEITVKRWMSSQDFGFETLIMILNILEIDPLRLLEAGLSNPGHQREYTDEQESYFASHPVSFLVFIKILTGLSFEQLRDLTKMNASQLNRTFRELEAIGAARLEPGNKIKLLIKGPFRWQEKGRLNETYFDRYRQAIYGHFERYTSSLDLPKNQEESLFRPFEFYLDTPTALQFMQELAYTVLKYRSMAHSRTRQWPGSRAISGVVAVDFFDSFKAILMPKEE